MSILNHVKFDAMQEFFPDGMAPSLRYDLHFSSQLLHKRRIKSTIRFVVTAPPPKRPGKSIVFHAFATNRTAFGVIQDLESIFTVWFLETKILPIINPIPMKYFEEPELLPKVWRTSISQRGVRLYSYATPE